MFRFCTIAFLTLLTIAVVISALNIKNAPKAIKQLTGIQLIQYINQNQNQWNAIQYPHFSNKRTDELKKYLGAYTKPSRMHQRMNPISKMHIHKKVPTSFDAVKAWHKCADIIGIIQDQSMCGSCWAISTTSVMNDRLCIASKGKVKTSISALDLMSCCTYCGDQCNGGYPNEAFYYFETQGIVTGSNFTNAALCKPYPIEPCKLIKETGKISCPQPVTETYMCEDKCQSNYIKEKYNDDHYYGKHFKEFNNNNDEVIKELITNGPLVATFNVYEDFYMYKSGIYKYTGGEFLGGHAVRLVGYGTENGTDYWKVANSWNNFWGENGYFRIVRGTNECDFESSIYSVMADVKRSLVNKKFN